MIPYGLGMFMIGNGREKDELKTDNCREMESLEIQRNVKEITVWRAIWVNYSFVLEISEGTIGKSHQI